MLAAKGGQMGRIWVFKKAYGKTESHPLAQPLPPPLPPTIGFPTSSLLLNAHPKSQSGICIQAPSLRISPVNLAMRQTPQSEIGLYHVALGRGGGGVGLSLSFLTSQAPALSLLKGRRSHRLLCVTLLQAHGRCREPEAISLVSCFLFSSCRGAN